MTSYHVHYPPGRTVEEKLAIAERNWVKFSKSADDMNAESHRLLSLINRALASPDPKKVLEQGKYHGD